MCVCVYVPRHPGSAECAVYWVEMHNAPRDAQCGRVGVYIYIYIGR